MTVDDNNAFDTAGLGGGIAFRGKRNLGGVQTVYGAIDVLKESTAGDSYTGSMRFYTNQNSTWVPLERMRIDSSGAITMNSGEYFSWGTTGATAIEGSTVSNKMSFYTNSTKKFTIEDDNQIRYAGDFYFSTNTSNGSDDGSLNFSGGGGFGSTRGASIGLAGNEDGNGGLIQLIAGNGPTSNIRFYTSTQIERMRLQANGRLTLGDNLTLSAANNLTLTNASSAEIDINCTGGHNYRITSDTSDAFIITDKTAALERMRIDSSGNSTFTGEISANDDINVNNGKLVVNHTSAEVRIKSSSDTGESYINFSDPSDINPGQIYYGHNNNAMVFRTNDAERMRIDSSGNVGITAAAYLGFNGAGDASHSVGYNAGIDGAILRGQNGIILGTGGGATANERMRITSGGAISLANNNTAVIGRPYASGTITNGQSVSVNLNSAGGNQAGGFLVISAVPNNVNAGGAVEIWTHVHTQGANVYSKLSGREENNITISESAGSFTISNSSGSTVYYNVKVLNLTDFASTIAGT